MTSFYIHTTGDSTTVADSEQMAGLLQQAAFTPAETIDHADIVIFNIHVINGHVNGQSEAALCAMLENFKKEHPYKLIVIAGCVLGVESQQLKQYPFVSSRNIHHIVEVVEEALNDNVIHML